MNIYKDPKTIWIQPMESTPGSTTSVIGSLNINSYPYSAPNQYYQHQPSMTMMSMTFPQYQQTRLNPVEEETLTSLKYWSKSLKVTGCINKNRIRMGLRFGTPDPNIPCSASEDDPLCWHCWTSEPYNEPPNKMNFGPVGEGRYLKFRDALPKLPIIEPKITQEIVKPMYECVFCKGNNETEEMTHSHPLRINNVIICPTLRNKTCMICKATGDKAHTIKYCPFNKRGFFADKAKARGELMDQDQRLMTMSEPPRIKPVFFTSMYEKNSHYNRNFERFAISCHAHSQIPPRLFVSGSGHKLPVVRRLDFNSTMEQEMNAERKRANSKYKKGFIIGTKTSKRGKSVRPTRSSTTKGRKFRKK